MAMKRPKPSDFNTSYWPIRKNSNIDLLLLKLCFLEV